MAEVRNVERADVAAVAGSLIRAFHDDPVMLYLTRRPAKRERQLTSFFSGDLGRSLRAGEAFTTHGEVLGGSVWFAPDQWRMGGLELVRSFPMLFTFGRDVPHALRLLNAVEKQHPKEPHWYLAVLGTDPRFQGKGVGSALLQPVLDRCDQEGLPAYLESSKESNIPFYRRHGFEVTGEIEAGPGAPTIYPMWRDPR